MILHSLVARGSLVLADYTESDEDFNSISRKILVKIKKTEDK